MKQNELRSRNVRQHKSSLLPLLDLKQSLQSLILLNVFILLLKTQNFFLKTGAVEIPIIFTAPCFVVGRNENIQKFMHRHFLFLGFRDRIL